MWVVWVLGAVSRFWECSLKMVCVVEGVGVVWVLGKAWVWGVVLELWSR
jgi:hypothetical protein